MNFLPFKNLDAVLEEKCMKPTSPATRTKESIDTHEGDDPWRESILFEKAMEDVVPLRQNHVIDRRMSVTASHCADSSEEREALDNLKSLVDSGKGFVVAHTPEYVEGSSYGGHPEMAQRLHRGDFSIQAHIDLHGFTVTAARPALDAFIAESVRTGKRAVMVIHGRGRSSPVKPVLKKKVIQWLCESPLQKWVIAFSSAPLFDGGAGATYVLLRRRPATKGMRKRIRGRAHGRN